jgi:dihydroorotate dehydrogenase electron transfer subunit
MPEYQENSRVEAIERLSSTFYRLTLVSPRIAAAARPGQFVMASCGTTFDPLLRRPFSIHRCTRDGQLQLLFRVVGQGTRLLSELKADQSLSLIGPLGQGFHIHPAESVALVGGGIGIAPLLFLAAALRQAAGGETLCHAFLGSRTAEEVSPMASDFSALGCRVETATDDGSMGYHGLVTDLLVPHLAEYHRVYTCGPHAMMAAVARLCETAGIGCEVSLEAHMACGLGACLGCTVHGVGDRYLHVCTHGPVLDAQEVAWHK